MNLKERIKKLLESDTSNEVLATAIRELVQEYEREVRKQSRKLVGESV